MYIFLDLETTGINPEKDFIIELGAAVVDDDFEIVDERNYVFPMSNWIQEKLDGADPIVQEMHTSNHLIAEMNKLAAQGNSLSYGYYRRCLEMVLLEWFSQCGLTAGECPMAGETIHFDRAFLKLHMPVVEEFFHYRDWEVSTLKRATQMWAPNYYRRNPFFEAPSSHRALSDVRMAVEYTRLVRNVFSISEQVWPGQSDAKASIL
jgi:oligoribonuclease